MAWDRSEFLRSLPDTAIRGQDRTSGVGPQQGRSTPLDHGLYPGVHRHEDSQTPKAEDKGLGPCALR